MEIKTTTVTANRLAARENVQFLQEGDVIVPDSKADIDKILKTSGTIIIEDTNISEGRLTYKGHITLDCLYLSKGEGRKLHTMSKDIEVNDFIAISGIEENMSAKLKCTIENIDTGVLNERKINYRISGNADADVSETVEIQAVSAIEDLPDNQQKMSVIKTSRNICSKSEKINIKEEVILPPGKLPVDEIISIEPVLLNTEAVAVQDGVKISGDITASMLYTSSESAVPEVFEIDIPFDGNIEAEDAEPGMEVNADLTISEFYYEVSENEEGENRVINIEVVINACVDVNNQEENEILEDAYSVNNSITMENETLCYDREVCRNKSQCPVKDIVAIEENCPSMLQIIKASGTPCVDMISIFDNKVVIDGVVNVSILYVTGDDTMPVYCGQGVVPFSQTIEARGAKEGMKATVDCVLSHIGFNMISDREVEVRCALNTNTAVSEKVCAVLATAANIEPLDKDFINSIATFIIYTVQKGDTLWKLAKRFNTTVEDILEVNDIENPDLIYPGQRLIIVKHVH